MKVFKKITSGIIALTLCAGMTSLNVGATSSTYLKGDVDGDGAVTMADLASMQSFLHGNKGAGGAIAERLDVYKDYVIGGYDRLILSSILVGDISASYVTSDNTNSLPDQHTRSYKKYSPTTGNLIGSYTIGIVSNIASSSSSSYSINENDDRKPENGLEGVINVQYSNGNNCGTAFVVDSHTLLTAAHVIYGERDLRFKIFSDYNTESDVQITPTAYHIPSLYTTSATPYKYDYAIVTVNEDLSDYINFDLGLMRNGMSEGRDIYITGFGGDGVGVSDNLVDNKSTGIGHLSNVHKSNSQYEQSYWNYQLYYDTDTAPGNSGSPVYVKNPNGTNTAIAIHTQGDHDETPDVFDNRGTRITTDILKFVYNNPNL